MGRHHHPNPPAPPQAKTAAISQARQAASQAYHARSAFSSLNSRQPNPASLSIVVEDDGLTSYDEAEGDDGATATAAAPAGGEGGDRGDLLFTSESSPPPPGPHPQPAFQDPAAGRQMNYRIIGFGKEHEEYHPAHPHFDNPAPVRFSAFGGPPAALAPPHPHVPNGLVLSPPFGPHHAQAQTPHHALSGFPPPPIRGPSQSAFQPPPISGPPHSAIPRPPINVPLQSAFPPPSHASQSAFPLPPIQGRLQSAFPPPAISGSPQSASPPPPVNGPPQSAANNNNNNRLGRQSRWGVSPEQVAGMHPHCQSEPRPPWREQQQQHHHHQQQPQQPGRTWGDSANGGGWQNNQGSKQGQHQGGWGAPVPTAHHGGHQTHWGPRGGNVPHGHGQSPFNGHGGHNQYSQPPMSYRHQQHHDHGNDPDQMDVTVSEETATAFLNNIFTDLQGSGVAAYPPVTALNHVNQSMECMPMDTSPNFYGPSVVVVDDNVIHHHQDMNMNMDVDSQPILPPSNAYSQALAHAGSAGPGYGFGSGYGAIQPGPPRPILLPLPPEDVNMEVVVHDNRNHHRHPSSDAMMVDVDSPKPSNAYVLGSSFGGGGARAADASAPVVIPFNGPFYEPEPVPAKVKAKPKALPTPEDVRSSPVAAKAKPHPVAGGSKSKDDVGKAKSQPVKDKGKVGNNKENIAVNPKSAVDASKAKASMTKVKAKPKAQSVISTDEPRRIASAGPSGLVHDEKARLVPVSSQPVKDKGRAKAQSEVVKDEAQPAVSKAKGKAKTDLGIVDDGAPSQSVVNLASSQRVDKGKSRAVGFEDKPKVVVVPDKAQSASNKGKSKASVVNETKSQLDMDKRQSEVVVVKSAVGSNPFSPENFDSLDDEQAIVLIKSQLAKAENLLAELQSQSSDTLEAPPPPRLVQARKPKLDAKAQSDVVPQCPSTYTPEYTPPRRLVQAYNVDVEQNGGNFIQSPISYTPKDMPHNQLVRTDLDKDAQHAVVKPQPFSTYTPKDTPPNRLVQAYEPDLVRRHQASLLSVTQSAPPALVDFHSLRVESSKAKPLAAGVEEVDTPMYALPALSPATGGSTYEVVDTFKNVKAFRPSAPCTPPTPSPMPTPLLSATRSDDNCFTADLIDFDNEFSSLTLNELSSVKSEPLICFDKVQPSTPIDGFDWTASLSVWDDLASLDQFFVSSTISVNVPPEVSPEELDIDDMLAEKFATCLSLLDKPLLDLTTPDEVERGCESRPFNVVPLMTEISCPVQLPERVGKYDEAVRINDRIEAAAQEIQDINHRLLLNVESVRPMRVHLKVNKRKVGSKLRPTKNTRTPRYIESRTQTDEQPVKRIRVSVSGDSNNVVIAVPVGSSTISLTLSSHDEPASKSPPPLEQSVELMSIPVPEGNLAPPQKVMPGHFPLDESEVQYGPGIGVLLRKLLYLCFGW